MPGGGDGEVGVGAGPALPLPLRELEAAEPAAAVRVAPVVKVLEVALQVGVELWTAGLEEAPRELVLVVGNLKGNSIEV